MIKFENIRTGEVKTFDGSQDPNTRQAHIAAYLNSSNLSPNALKGQDFGWRLAPEIVDEIERIKSDLVTLDMLSKRLGIPVDELRDFHILNYIAEQDFAAEAIRQRQLDKAGTAHEADYEARVKALRARRTQANETLEETPVVAPRPVKNPGEETATTTVSEKSDSSDETPNAKIATPNKAAKQKEK